jgi:iron complex outermembrane receptor protein
MKSFHSGASLIALGLIALLSAPARAADAGAQADAAPAVEEIVVTALRRDTTLSKTPAAISAVTGAQLTTEGVTQAKDLPNVLPNIEQSVVGFAIRGVSSADFTEKGDSATAYNVNGVYIARFTEQQLALYDLDRVEVLRGPQGTLYGRNATAGVINVISSRPKDEFGGDASVEYGNYNTVRLNSAVNTPLTDGVDMRLAGTYNRHDGFTPTHDGTKALDDQNDYAFRASLLARLGSNTDLLIVGDYGKIDEAGPANIAAARALAQNDDHSLRYALPGIDNHYRLSAGGVVAELNSNFDFAKLTYVGSYRHSSLDVLNTKNDVSAFTQSDRVVNESKHDQVTQEIRLASNPGGPLQWVGGLYYFHEKSPYTDYLNLCCFFKATFGYQQEVKATSYAAFGQATYSFTDHLRLTGGLRFTSDTKSRIGIFSPDFTPAVDPATGVTVTVQNNPALFAGKAPNYIGYYPGGDAPRNKVTYKVQMEGDLSQTVIAYAKVETGYKAGAFNDGTSATSTASKPFVYQPEIITDFEGGIKGNVLDDKLYFALNAFHYNYQNHQIPTIAPTGGAFTYNAPAKVNGAEIEGSFKPLANTKIHYSASVLEAKFGHFMPATTDFFDEQLDFAPKFSARAGVTQDIPLGNGGRLSGDVSAKYSSAYFVTDYISGTRYVQPKYTRTDVKLGYFAPLDKWYVQAYGENLENKRELGVVEVGGFSLTNPVQYGVRAGLKF